MIYYDHLTIFKYISSIKVYISVIKVYKKDNILYYIMIHSLPTDILEVVKNQYFKLKETEKYFEIWKNRTIVLQTNIRHEKQFFKCISIICNKFYDTYFKAYDYGDLDYIDFDRNNISFENIFNEEYYNTLTYKLLDYDDIIKYLKYMKIYFTKEQYEKYNIQGDYTSMDKRNPYNIFFQYLKHNIYIYNIQYL